MGYNRENFKRIRAEYEGKAFRAQANADERREELYGAIPELRPLDAQRSAFGLRIMQTALSNGNTEAMISALREENERMSQTRGVLLEAHGYPRDYDEVRYECMQCRDTGYVGIRMCRCMHRALIEAGMESSGLASLMRTQSFDNFSLEYYAEDPKAYRVMEEHYRNLYQYAHRFSIEQGKPMPSNLLFLGGTGLGKTHLSTAVARVVIERGYDVYYNSAVGLVSDFESRRFGNGLAAETSDDIARYVECDLLIIDDLGTEVVNQFTLSCLYYVLNTRLNRNRPMIVNTNLMPADLRKIYSDRIASRLTGEFSVLPFYGTDVRRQKLQKK